ncbi:MAG: hypothetical protein JWM28_3853 [Chitinophagaceae bacterium]|nr:hypothetical protein [Chitinophagaceae bacterium]
MMILSDQHFARNKVRDFIKGDITVLNPVIIILL